MNFAPPLNDNVSFSDIHDKCNAWLQYYCHNRSQLSRSTPALLQVETVEGKMGVQILVNKRAIIV
jgi:hypothetical protein